jgi:predicted small lipoprotein YifL
MRLILSLTAVVLIVVVLLSGCGHKPPQEKPPGIGTAPGTTKASKNETGTLQYKAEKQQCKNGVCK